MKPSNRVVSGTCTYSKAPMRYVEGVYPRTIERGDGAYVYDKNGREFIDYTGALGANLLGYAHPYVNERVKERIDMGIIFGMPSEREAVLAELIHSIIPSMEKMRFLKSGSEAVSAGIKIARAYTKRDMVLTSGYHGWHDWSTPVTQHNLGTPETVGSNVSPFDYGDLKELEGLLRFYDVACVVLDPYIFHEPPNNYLRDLIKLAHKHGALVLFDEVVTGIRWTNYSVQGAYDVRPDLTAIGKAMANGFPISAIGGKARVMDMVDKGCFVSSTFGGELASIEAAIATIEFMKKEDGTKSIFYTGSYLQEMINHNAKEYEHQIECIGHPARQRIEFPSDAHKALFWQTACDNGVLFGASQHTTLAHYSHDIMFKTENAVIEAMRMLDLYRHNPKKGLRGSIPKPVMAIQSLRK